MEENNKPHKLQGLNIKGISDDERQKKLKVAFDLIVEIAIRALRLRSEQHAKRTVQKTYE